MAIDKVKQAFLDIDNAVSIVNQEVIKLNTNLKGINETLSSNKGLSTLVKNINALNTAQQQNATLSKTQIGLLTKEEGLRKQVALADKAVEQAIQAKNRTSQQELTISKKVTAQQQKIVTETAKLTSAYAKLSAKAALAAQRAREIGAAQGTSSKAFEKARKSALDYNTQLQKINSKIGSYQMNVGNYASGISKLTAAFGAVGGVMLFAKAVKSAFDISKKYEKQNAELASILGKTLKQTTLLQDESKRLGSTTAFSATQVTELQTELARLGTSEEDIISSTEGIITATIALGSETGETAALVGATLNAFQLGASESSKVADVLTLSTQRSALSFTKLNTALPIAGGAAAAAGVSFEKMVAQLGKAADRGIDASTAATSLRNIYIELAKNGLTFDEAMQRINLSQDKLSTSVGLFGKRAAVTALALAATTDETNDLTTALENAGGTADAVAKTQLNTLDGQLKLLNSAWEGLILNINNADTAIGQFSVNTVKFLSKAINQIANIGSEFELMRRSMVGGFESADDALLKYIIDTGRVKDSNGDILDVKGVLDEVTASYNKLDDEMKGLIDLNENLAIALLKAGGDAEVVDRIVKIYTDDLNKQSEALAEVVDKTKEKVEQEVKAVKVETDLIKIQEVLLSQAKKMSGATEPDIAQRNIKIDGINEEIARLKALGKVQEVPDKVKTDILGSEFDPIAEKGYTLAELEKMEEDAFDREYDAQKAQNEKLIDLENEKNDQIQALKESAFEAAGTVINEGFTRYTDSLWDEVDAQTEADQARLDNDMLDAEQQEQIQKDLDKREAARKTEAAKKEKKANIIQSIINTALSITKTIATLGFPAAIPGIIAAGILGAANTALIASQPIPQYDKGTENFQGIGIMSEVGPEIKVHKGKAELVTKPTLIGSESHGDKIIGRVATAAILENATRSEALNYADKQISIQMDISNKILGEKLDKILGATKANRPVNRDIGKDRRAMKMGSYVKKFEA